MKISRISSAGSSAFHTMNLKPVSFFKKTSTSLKVASLFASSMEAELPNHLELQIVGKSSNNLVMISKLFKCDQYSR